MNNVKELINALPCFQRADAAEIIQCYEDRIKLLESRLARADAMMDNVEGWILAELKRADVEMEVVWQRRLTVIRETRQMTTRLLLTKV